MINSTHLKRAFKFAGAAGTGVALAGTSYLVATQAAVLPQAYNKVQERKAEMRALPMTSSSEAVNVAIAEVVCLVPDNVQGSGADAHELHMRPIRGEAVAREIGGRMVKVNCKEYWQGRDTKRYAGRTGLRP